jgi:hypothetical protein
MAVAQNCGMDKALGRSERLHVDGTPQERDEENA